MLDMALRPEAVIGSPADSWFRLRIKMAAKRRDGQCALDRVMEWQAPLRLGTCTCVADQFRSQPDRSGVSAVGRSYGLAWSNNSGELPLQSFSPPGSPMVRRSVGEIRAPWVVPPCLHAMAVEIGTIEANRILREAESRSERQLRLMRDAAERSLVTTNQYLSASMEVSLAAR